MLVDRTSTTFGIRTLKFDANKGFFLNGRRVQINGAASHQDFAGVGIAVPDSLQAWRVQQIKNAGGNAWRCAHNPPNEALLDACDRMGMLVMDENKADHRDSFHGHCVAVIQACTHPGDLELAAASPGLKPARVEFSVR